MKLDALLPYLLPDVPGVPDITALQALRLSTIRFCEETLAWDEIQDPVPLEDGVNEYDLDVEQGSRIAAIKNVWLADRPLTPVSMEELSQRLPNWQTATGSDPVYYNAPADQNAIRIYPIPDGVEDFGKTMTLRVVYVPTLAATTVPDSVLNLYLEPIIHGAKYRLMVAPGKGWSNPQLAVYHQAEFEKGVHSAKIDILHEGVQGSLRVKPLRFGF